jgi:tetratricopeptide (TPR) repeat protein
LAREYPNDELYRSDLTLAKQTWFAALAASGDREAIKKALPQIDEMVAIEGNARTLNDLAWNIVAPGDIDRKMAEAAVRAALRACELQPRWAGYLNTLGVAQYRRGEYTAAIESLGHSRALDQSSSSTSAAVDCYFLAMAHAKLGDGELAEKWFRAADLWMALVAVTNEELKRFRAEAIDVVGVEAEPISSKSLTPEAEQELLQLCVAADPKGAWIHYWMAERLADRGTWAEADKQLTQVADSLFENAKAAACYALVRLKLGDRDGYKRACVTMCERFGEAGPPDSHWLAWACGLVPDALPDMSLPLAQAGKCACWHGLLLFRCGQYKDAADRLNERTAGPETHILLAMTHWRLGQKDEARKRMSQARSGNEQKSLAKMSWDQRATVELLLAEAEQMIPSAD